MATVTLLLHPRSIPIKTITQSCDICCHFPEFYLQYCPRQAPIGAQSSSAKYWGWTVARRRWFSNSPARAYPRCEVSCQGVPNRLASLLRPCFVKANLTVEKAVTCYNANQLVYSSLPSFCSIQSLLAVHKLRAAGKNTANKAMEGVCEPDVVAPKTHQNNCSYVSSADLPSDSLCKDLAWIL